MLKSEFISLNLEERTEYLWRFAELVSQKVYYDSDISLFLMDGYYVEVFFNQTEKQIVSVEIQENNQILYGYVKDLNISCIVSWMK